ncbi:VanZ family protein [Seonamhaeicola sp. MEBiC1930]|uniref:VanZ family protein n=1 Tax=Seonamhaeicola sp. MEBiC01930 TaxID=2976768 RepID=UPI003255F710
MIVVSLIRLNNLPDIKLSFGDKIFHFGAYAVLTIFWFYSFINTFNFKFKKALVSALILSVIFGIVIEVLQGKMTDYRAFDVYDALANTLGALLATSVILLTKSFNVKNL